MNKINDNYDEEEVNYLICFMLTVKLKSLQYGNDDIRGQSVGDELFRSEKPYDWTA